MISSINMKFREKAPRDKATCGEGAWNGLELVFLYKLVPMQIDDGQSTWH
jgi:hypothetical protein